MKESIRVQLKQIKKMSVQGQSHWHRRLRKKISQDTFHSLHPETVNVKDIDTIDKIIEYTWMKGGPGKWHFSTCCRASNRFHVSYKTLCIIELENNPNKDSDVPYKAKFKDRRLKRYWFWKNANKQI